tara:strand:- start:2825 stop:3643 length:819 start_codon:yes stop_codon:yes gene_type:complete
MRILVTGAHGFLGREFIEHYSKTEHDTIAAPRQVLDLTSREAVDKFFENNNIDIILHTAVKGEDSFDDFTANINMFKNLKSHSKEYKLMFSFGSGAAFDRFSDVREAKEEEIYANFPQDYYGLAKNIIAREINRHNDNIINLRLFGCFGKHEKSTRFIKNSLRRIAGVAPIVIEQDREMDFFYVKDLLRVIDHFIENGLRDLVDINMCYDTRCSLKMLAHEINVLTGATRDAIIINENKAPSYTGNAQKLKNLNLELGGLSAGLREMCSEYK